MTETTPAPTLRRARPEDRAEILEVCAESLGWRDGDPNADFFAWKHDENSAGASPAWVAEDPSGGILGVRFFLRWQFRRPDGRTVDAVRAVDTATRPEARGLGIFRRLTLGALPDLVEDGTGFVFNTPNGKSRPGYLKMGWSVVGQVPLGVAPTGRPARGGAEGWSGADKWGLPSTAGVDPTSVFADADAVARLLARLPASGKLATARTPAYLRWRYGFGPLNYRVFPAGDRIEDGLVVFRLRERGGRVDATICEELLPARRAVEPLWLGLARATRAHLLLRTQSELVGPGPFVRVRRLGPTLTWKPLADPTTPPLGRLDLSYGDLELF